MNISLLMVTIERNFYGIIQTIQTLMIFGKVNLEEVEVGEKTSAQADEIIGEKLVAAYIKPEDKSR